MISLSILVHSPGEVENADEALQRTLASLDNCVGLTKEVLLWQKTDAPSELCPGSDGHAPSPWSALDNCLAKATGDLIWVLEEAEALDGIDWGLFQEQIKRLQSDAKAVCLLPSAPGPFPPTTTTRADGAYFLFACLVNLYAPGIEPFGLIFKNTRKPLSVNPKLTNLAISDLCFQLLRQGYALFGPFQTALPGWGPAQTPVSKPTEDATLESMPNSAPAQAPAPEKALEDWLLFAAQYASLLNCLGSAPEYLHQLLTQRYLKPDELQKLANRHILEIDELAALKSDFLRSVDTCSQANANLLWNAVCFLVGRDGLPLEQKLSEEGHFLVAASEVKKHEEKLRSLLLSRSWKSTKWLRDLRRSIVSEASILPNGDLPSLPREFQLSGAAYLRYLKSQIDTIYASKSWFLTRPLRVWESLAQEGD